MCDVEILTMKFVELKTPHWCPPTNPQQVFITHPQIIKQSSKIKNNKTHGENGGTLGMVPLIINPIYTLYSGYLLGFMGYIPF